MSRGSDATHGGRDVFGWSLCACITVAPCDCFSGASPRAGRDTMRGRKLRPLTGASLREGAILSRGVADSATPGHPRARARDVWDKITVAQCYREIGVPARRAQCNSSEPE